jgi:LacI family transcriptional regulator
VGEKMTIYDIARACNVSIATVSRVLNGSNKVRPSTRKKILAAMQDQNYSPNPFARGLGLDSMKMIGILCTDVSDAFFAKAISLVEHNLRERGFEVILGCTGTDLEDKKRFLQIMLNQHVDAIILVGSSYREDNDNTHLAEAANKVPIITINSSLEIPNVYCVVCDEGSGFRRCTEILADRGCKSILYLYDRLTYSGQQKLKGYKAGLKKTGLKENPELMVLINRTLEDAQNLVQKYIDEHKHFDAILAAEDILAVGAQKALVANKMSLPVIGCNNSILAACSTPSLTSIDNRLDALCPAAVSVLLQVLNKGETPVPSITTFPPILIYRDSFKKE